MLDLSEIYYSIQGESSYAGMPCVIIRLAGCNLRCSYCDTEYSYKKELSLSCIEIIDKVKSYRPINLVQVTGGEPLLQNNVYNLFHQLDEIGSNIILETNGSLPLDKVPYFVIKIVDVKCPSSGCSDDFNKQNIDYLSEKDEVKFVISDRNDYLYAVDFYKQHLSTLPNKVLFSAVSNRLSPNVLAQWILDDRVPVRLQVQLHKIIWGNDIRGV